MLLTIMVDSLDEKKCKDRDGVVSLSILGSSGARDPPRSTKGKDQDRGSSLSYRLFKHIIMLNGRSKWYRCVIMIMVWGVFIAWFAALSLVALCCCAQTCSSGSTRDDASKRKRKRKRRRQRQQPGPDAASARHCCRRRPANPPVRRHHTLIIVIVCFPARQAIPISTDHSHQATT